MNILEGARRVQYAGRALLALAAGVFTVTMLLVGIARFTTAFPLLQFSPALILLSFYPALLGTVFLVTGWIIEGFALPPNRNSPGD